MNTALRRLRDEELLEFRRGRGVSVLRRPEAHSALSSKARELVDEAKRYGYGTQDVVRWIQEPR